MESTQNLECGYELVFLILWPKSHVYNQAQVMLPSKHHNLSVKQSNVSEAGKFVGWLKDFVEGVSYQDLE